MVVGNLQSIASFAPYLLFGRQSVILAHMDWRICYCHSIHLVEEDHLIVHIQDGPTETLDRGDILYIPSGQWHRLVYGDPHPSAFKSLYFDWTYMSRPELNSRRNYFHIKSDPYYRDYIAWRAPFKLRTILKAHVLSHWKTLTEPIMDYDITEHNDYYALLKIQTYFMTFLREYMQYAVLGSDIGDPRIANIIHVMDTHADAEDQTLDHWIKESGISRRHFYNLFKSQTGTTPMKYWNELRVLKSKEDLKNSDHTITDIAGKYHFSSIHYYSKLFKRLNGVSPTEYRKGYFL